MTGGSNCGGTFFIALATFSRTSLAASLMSRSSTNLIVSCALPSLILFAAISSTPDRLLSASSIGSMTDVDISSGLAPGSVRLTLTVAGSARGKSSTPRLLNEKIPSTTSDMTSMVANTGRRTQSSESMAQTYGYRAVESVTLVPSFRVSTSFATTRSPAFTPASTSTRSPSRSPILSSRMAR